MAVSLGVMVAAKTVSYWTSISAEEISRRVGYASDSRSSLRLIST